jgi:hypothetical protein
MGPAGRRTAEAPPVASIRAIDDPRARFRVAHTALQPYIATRRGLRHDQRYHELRRIRTAALRELITTVEDLGGRVSLTEFGAALDPPLTRQALHHILHEAPPAPDPRERGDA